MPVAPGARELVSPRSLEPLESTAERTVVPGVPEKGPADRSRDSIELAQSEGLRFGRVLVEHMNRALRFYKDEESGRIAAEIVDRETREVIRSIPPEEVLKLAARMADAAEILFGHRGDPSRPEPPVSR